MPGLFITATGTDIGKTFVTAGLIRALRARGQKVMALKPIVSGFNEMSFARSDPALLLDAMGRAVSLAELDLISPWRFNAPLSPDMAARKEGRSIDFDEVLAYCRNTLETNSDLVMIEGVGGIMVPLNEHLTVLDLMQSLALPVVLVAGSYLGTISHLLSALDVLKGRDLFPRAIVINESEGASVTMEDTLETLSHFCGDAPLIALARQKPEASSEAAFTPLITALRLA